MYLLLACIFTALLQPICLGKVAYKVRTVRDTLLAANQATLDKSQLLKGNCENCGAITQGKDPHVKNSLLGKSELEIESAKVAKIAAGNGAMSSNLAGSINSNVAKSEATPINEEESKATLINEAESKATLINEAESEATSMNLAEAEPISTYLAKEEVMSTNLADAEAISTKLAEEEEDTSTKLAKAEVASMNLAEPVVGLPSVAVGVELIKAPEAGEGFLSVAKTESNTIHVPESETVSTVLAKAEATSMNLAEAEPISTYLAKEEVTSTNLADAEVISTNLAEGEEDTSTNLAEAEATLINVPEPVVGLQSVAVPVVESIEAPEAGVEFSSVAVAESKTVNVPDDGLGLTSVPVAGVQLQSVPESQVGLLSLAVPIVELVKAPEAGIGFLSVAKAEYNTIHVPEAGVGLTSVPVAGVELQSVPESEVGLLSIAEADSTTTNVPEDGIDLLSVDDAKATSTNVAASRLKTGNALKLIEDKEALKQFHVLLHPHHHKGRIDPTIVSEAGMGLANVLKAETASANVAGPGILISNEAEAKNAVQVRPHHVHHHSHHQNGRLQTAIVSEPGIGSANVVGTRIASKDLVGAVKASVRIAKARKLKRKGPKVIQIEEVKELRPRTVYRYSHHNNLLPRSSKFVLKTGKSLRKNSGTKKALTNVALAEIPLVKVAGPGMPLVRLARAEIAPSNIVVTGKRLKTGTVTKRKFSKPFQKVSRTVIASNNLGGITLTDTIKAGNSRSRHLHHNSHHGNEQRVIDVTL